jgi:creatinine amidohydrolase
VSEDDRPAMRIADMNWMQVEHWLARDDRAVLPVGSTEQHAYLSLATDSILAERVAAEAAEPLGVPVFPAIAYGVTPHFRAYPGSVTVREDTLAALVCDVLDALDEQGFARVLVVNGHGGNAVLHERLAAWRAERPDVQVRVHDWWRAPLTWAKAQAIDPAASHASWMENFPWTRLPGVAMPGLPKPPVDVEALKPRGPEGVREGLGDGNFGGLYQRSDDDVFALWRVAVEETRALIARGWEP